MKKLFILFFFVMIFFFSSCISWKKYHRIDSIRAIRISSKNINRLERTTPFNFEYLLASRGDYIVFDGKKFTLMPYDTFRNNYKKRKKR